MQYSILWFMIEEFLTLDCFCPELKVWEIGFYLILLCLSFRRRNFITLIQTITNSQSLNCLNCEEENPQNLDEDINKFTKEIENNS